MDHGSILKDLIESEEIQTIKLDKIFRQAAKSKIIVNAHRVNNGESFIKKEDSEYLDDMDEDFFYMNEVREENIVNQVISLCNGRLKKYGNYDFVKNIQILTPTKKGRLGTKELNQSIQASLNPKSEKTKEMQSLGMIYRVGDRVMQIKNNYEIAWERTVDSETKTGECIFNGEIGIIEEIDHNEKEVYIRFDDDKLAIYDFLEMEQIEHSYAITIHKSQR